MNNVQLGISGKSNNENQCQIPDNLPEIVQISAGAFHSMALDVNGKVHVWGSDDDNQCKIPLDLPKIVKISVGTFHSMVLDINGKIHFWGDDSRNQYHSNLSKIEENSSYAIHLMITSENKKNYVSKNTDSDSHLILLDNELLTYFKF